MLKSWERRTRQSDALTRDAADTRSHDEAPNNRQAERRDRLKYFGENRLRSAESATATIMGGTACRSKPKISPRQIDIIDGEPRDAKGAPEKAKEAIASLNKRMGKVEKLINEHANVINFSCWR